MADSKPNPSVALEDPTELSSDSGDMRHFLHSLVDWPSVHSVIDLGCGRGTDLLLIADKLPSDARLLGVDCEGEKLQVARTFAEQQGKTHVEFRAGDLCQVGEENASFDVLLNINVLELLADKQRFFREAHRLLKPNGLFLCAHFDWDSQIINANDKHLARKLISGWSDFKQPWMQECDGWMGRRLFGTIRSAGLFEGECRVYTLVNTEYKPEFYGWKRIQDFGTLAEHGLVDEQDYLKFLQEMESLQAAGHYFYSINLYTFVGRKLNL